MHTFEFVDDNPMINFSLKLIKTSIFEDIPMLMTSFHQSSMTVQHWMECYNIKGEPDDDGSHDINILEFKGTRVVQGSCISSKNFLKPLKIKKVNIGSQENPKFSNIRYYWDDETIGNIIDLLHEFQYLFPTKFTEMNGIVWDLAEMKILLKPDAKPIKKRPYRLNTRYKDKVKEYLDRILDAGIN